MAEKKHSYACVMEGILLGGAVGAAAGYLFAPRAEKSLEKAGSLYANVHDKTDKTAESGLQSIKSAMGRE